MEKAETMGITDVMQVLGVGRPTAERILNKYCQSAGKPHEKGKKYVVSKENFLMYVRECGI